MVCKRLNKIILLVLTMSLYSACRPGPDSEWTSCEPILPCTDPPEIDWHGSNSVNDVLCNFRFNYNAALNHWGDTISIVGYLCKGNSPLLFDGNQFELSDKDGSDGLWGASILIECDDNYCAASLYDSPQGELLVTGTIGGFYMDCNFVPTIKASTIQLLTK